MRIILSFLALTLIFTSCDDGDVITAALEFEDTFNTCGELVCYKIKANPSESLSILIENTTLETLTATTIDTDNALLVNLDNFNPAFPNVQFNYRTYNNTIGNDVFCSVIPPSNLGLTNDYISNATATFEIFLIEDDNDGILAELEDLNDDGNLENDDTDGDGIPNYMDDDDDGDNVPTKIEIEALTITTETELSQVRDTDNDTVANYLDTDDDNDGVLTINEENDTQDQNPANDIANINVEQNPDYLNNLIATSITATAFAEHTIFQEFQINLKVTGVTLSILVQDVVDFGTLTTTKSRTVTPSF